MTEPIDLGGSESLLIEPPAARRVVAAVVAERDALRAEVERLTGAVGTMSALLMETEAQLSEAEARAERAEAELVASRAAIREAKATLSLTLDVAQKFEAQASRGSGARRGSAVFTRARETIARLTALDMGDTDDRA